MRKRLLVSLVVLMLALALVTGCSQQQEAASEEATDDIKISGKPITLIVPFAAVVVLILGQDWWQNMQNSI